MPIVVSPAQMEALKKQLRNIDSPVQQNALMRDTFAGMEVRVDPTLGPNEAYVFNTGRQTATEIRERAREYDDILAAKYRAMDAHMTKLLIDGMYGLPGADNLNAQRWYDSYNSIPLALAQMATYGDTHMNLSAAVMLFEENGVRPVRVEYDPDTARNNNPNVVFKTIDPTIVVGDIVVVESHTRHKFTTAKVTAIGYEDVPVDFENPQKWGWVVSKADTSGYEGILAGEKTLVGKIAEASANDMRAKLKAAMGLDKVGLGDVFGKVRTGGELAAPVEPPVEEPAPAPAPDAG